MPLETAWHIVGKSSDYFAINTHFLLDFGDLLFMRRWYSPDFYNFGKVAQPLDTCKRRDR